MGFFDTERRWIQTEWAEAKEFLRKIQKNTATQDPPKPSLRPIIIRGTPAPTDHSFQTSKPFLYYGGMHPGSSPDTFLCFENYLTSIRFNTSTSLTPMRPGTVIPVPLQEKPATCYFTCDTADAINNHFIYELNSPLEIFDANRLIPFVLPTTGFVRRGDLQLSGGLYSQVVSFGAAQPVSGTIFPTSTKTIVRTAVSFSGTGNNTLVSAAGGGIKIKVIGMFLFASAATNLIIQSGAGGTTLIGQCNLTASQGFVLPIRPVDGEHWIETAANTLLNANQSGTAQVGGVVLHIDEA